MSDQKTVLIVEDDVAHATSIEEALDGEGVYRVLMASTGEEAVTTAERECPDMVLLDIILPKMDGISVLRHMRAMECLKNVPIVMLTNLQDAHLVEEAIASGSTDYLIKMEHPVEDVVARVKNTLQQ